MPQVNAISARLNGRLLRRKARNVQNADIAADRAQEPYNKLWSEILAVAMRPGTRAEVVARLNAIVQKFPARLAKVMDDLILISKDAWTSGVTDFTNSLPPDYITYLAEKKGKALREAETDEPRTDQQAPAPDRLGANFAEPGSVPAFQDVSGRVAIKANSQFRETGADLIFNPPSSGEIRGIINQVINGQTTEERLEELSGLITDPSGIVNRMADLISQVTVREIPAGSGNLVNVSPSLTDISNALRPFVSGNAASARRIARTEAMRAMELMNRNIWQQADPIIAGFIINEILDDVTRPEHAARNGDIYLKEPAASEQGLPPVSEMPILPDAPN